MTPARTLLATLLATGVLAATLLARAVRDGAAADPADRAPRGGCTGRVALTFDDGPAAPTGRLLGRRPSDGAGAVHAQPRAREPDPALPDALEEGGETLTVAVQKARNARGGRAAVVTITTPPPARQGRR